MLLYQMGLQLKLSIRGDSPIHALSVLQICFIVSCFGVYGIGPSISTHVMIKLLSQLFFSLPPYFIFSSILQTQMATAIFFFFLSFFFIVSVNDRNICQICSYKMLISLEKV